MLNAPWHILRTPQERNLFSLITNRIDTKNTQSYMMIFLYPLSGTSKPHPLYINKNESQSWQSLNRHGKNLLCVRPMMCYLLRWDDHLWSYSARLWYNLKDSKIPKKMLCILNCWYYSCNKTSKFRTIQTRCKFVVDIIRCKTSSHF